jgi:hypothetical protein
MVPAVSTNGPCGSAAAAMSRRCATLLDRPWRPGDGLALPRLTRRFDSALTSHWPVPDGRWTYGRTSLSSMLIGVGHGPWTPSRWCVPTWAQARSDAPGTRLCRHIRLPPVDPAPLRVRLALAPRCLASDLRRIAPGVNSPRRHPRPPPAGACPQSRNPETSHPQRHNPGGLHLRTRRTPSGPEERRDRAVTQHWAAPYRRLG